MKKRKVILDNLWRTSHMSNAVRFNLHDKYGAPPEYASTLKFLMYRLSLVLYEKLALNVEWNIEKHNEEE